MKIKTKLFTSLLLSAAMLIPASFSAQGKGKDKDDHDHGKEHGKDGKIKFKGKGDKLNINIKLGEGKKGKGNDDINIKLHPNGHGNKHDDFGHPGRGHAYGKYKWEPSKDVKHARGRYRDELRLTITLFRAVDLFLVDGRDRHNARNAKLDLSIKNGKIDIKVKERRAARLKLIDIKMKELDDLNGKSKLKLKVS